MASINDLIKMTYVDNSDEESTYKSRITRWDLLNYIKASSREKDFLYAPYEFSWQLTNVCNLNCAYCYNTYYSPKRKELSTEECFSVIDEIGALGLCDVTLEGGEIFTRHDIMDIIAKLKDNNIFIDILTNGYLINPQNANLLGSLLDKNHDGIQVSVDSTSSGGIDKILKEKIKMLVDEDINIRVNVVLTTNNVKFLDKLYRDALELGVHGGFSIAQVIPIGRGKMLNKPTVSDTIEAYLKLDKVKSNQLLISGQPAFIQSTKEFSEFAINTNKKIQKHNCSGGNAKLNIASDGELFPCAFLQYDEFRMGNILETDLIELWRSERIVELRSLLAKNPCGDCNNESTCTGGCFGAVYSVKSEFGHADPRCLNSYLGG